MNIICLDEMGNLSLRLDSIDDASKKKNIVGFLKAAKYQNVDDVWLFPKTSNDVKFLSIATQTKKKFEKLNLPIELCKQLSEKIFTAMEENSFGDVIKIAQKIKDVCSICEKKWDDHDEKQLLTCQKQYEPKTSSKFKRSLLPYQKKSVEHLIKIGNGANFSVPGSGKTTVTYAAISKWMDDGIINKILVIGPTPSFFPWEDEYRECFGEPPDVERISGEKANLLPKLDCKMFLMHFATVMYKTQKIIEFLQKPENKVVVIIDESHNIKNIDEEAKWAEAVRQIAPFATRRVILSGTPMPQNAADLWVQINFLWPYENILGNSLVFKRYTKNQGIGKWKSIVDPLFTRIKKSELGLDPPEFENYYVDLSSTQSEIYNVLAEKTLDEIYQPGRGKLLTYRKARIIRMLQVASNPALLYEQDDEFTLHDEYGFQQIPPLPSVESLDSELYKKIENYSKNGEIPAKLVQVVKLTRKLLQNGEKVIIWSNFLKNIRILENQLLKDENPIVIHGDISKDTNDDVNRDSFIKEFKDDVNPRVLIATPPSLSESVSLHINDKKQRVCSHAIYLERNFNAAQFVQSMDRIHRVGMDLKDDSSFTIDWEEDGKSIQKKFKRNQVYYHFFIAKNTIDTVIDERLWEKFENMNFALNDEWPQSLDYDGKRVIISKNQSENDFKSLVNHLKTSRYTNDDNES
jgi:hypothetical protein